MKSSITEEFREAFARLPKNIQRQARTAYHKFQDSPGYPGLHFKKVHAQREIYSIRITQNIARLVLYRMMKSSGSALVRIPSTTDY